MEGEASITFSRDAIWKMLQLYGAMSERRGIHDVVSSFSWVMNRVVIGSRGTVLGIRASGCVDGLAAGETACAVKGVDRGRVVVKNVVWGV